jgi:Ca2+-binding EF-hand superfamily protein
MAAQVEKAFATFDPSGSGVLHQSELREALQRMASAPLDERRLDEVLAELAGDSKDPGMATTITIASFARWMMGTYTKFLQDPSLVQDSVSKWPAFVYNQ